MTRPRWYEFRSDGSMRSGYMDDPDAPVYIIQRSEKTLNLDLTRWKRLDDIEGLECYVLEDLESHSNDHS